MKLTHVIWVEMFYNSIERSFSNINNYIRRQKLHNGEAIPLQALTGPEGARRLRIPDF
jgi:hypothetical protein